MITHEDCQEEINRLKDYIIQLKRERKMVVSDRLWSVLVYGGIFVIPTIIISLLMLGVL